MCDPELFDAMEAAYGSEALAAMLGIDDPVCAVCGGPMEWERCYACGGEGVDGHDCGEDVCCRLDPEDNEPCEVCWGEGGWWACCSLPHEGGPDVVPV